MGMEPTHRPSSPVSRLWLQEMSSSVPPRTSSCPRSNGVARGPYPSVKNLVKTLFTHFLALECTSTRVPACGGTADGAMCQGGTEEQPAGTGTASGCL